MAGYTNKFWSCPFFKWDEKLRVHCEGGVIRFRDRREAGEYQDCYCASLNGWKGCSVASSVARYYERTEQNAKRGQDQVPGKGTGPV